MTDVLTRRGFRRAAIAAILLAAGPAAADGWRPYANARFGYTVEVPASFKAGPVPENGDGSVFTSADYNEIVTVYGHLLTTDGDVAADAREAATSEQGDGFTLTYRAVTAGGYTLSGVSGSHIVYLHAIPTCGGIASATVRITYRSVDKARLDALVAHIARSLRGSAAC